MNSILISSMDDLFLKNISGIYKIVNTVNGKFYVGSSKDLRKRKRRHYNDLLNNKHGNIHLQRASNLYEINNFEFEILEYCEKEKLYEKEQYYLDLLKPWGDIGYNIGFKASGGDNFTNHPKREELRVQLGNHLINWYNGLTEEEKLKRNENIKGENNPNYGNSWSDEQKQHASNIRKEMFENGYIHPQKGTHISEEQKQHLSKIRLGKYTGKDNPFYGKTHSEETRKLLSEQRKGKPYIGNQNKKFGIENVLYNSLSEASRKLDIGIATIRWRLKSKNPRFKNYVLLN